MIVTAQFPTTVWDGQNSAGTRPDGNTRNAEPDYEDWDQISAEMKAVQTALTTLNGRNLTTVANANVIGAIPVLHRINIADGTGNTDVVLTHKTRIIDAWIVKTTAVGGSGDTITVKNGTTAITDAMDLNVADQAIVRAASINDASHEIAAAGTLRIAGASSTNCACVAYVLGLRVA